jgi:predicted Zn-dependent protease with MMP-like domain
VRDLSPAEFERLVAEALDAIPRRFAELLDNVAIQVEDEPDDDTLRDLDLDPRIDTIFGLYTGVPLELRGDGYTALPDVIVLYRLPLLEACESRGELVREVQLTLLHEIGHHLGFDEDEMDAWEDEFEPLDHDVAG